MIKNQCGEMNGEILYLIMLIKFAKFYYGSTEFFSNNETTLTKNFHFII